MGSICPKRPPTLPGMDEFDQSEKPTSKKQTSLSGAHCNKAVELDDEAIEMEQKKPEKKPENTQRYVENPIRPNERVSSSKREKIYILSPRDIECCIQEGRELVRSLYDYDRIPDETDMDLSKGDILEVLRKDGDWWWARNLETEEEGYIPSNYVAPENSLESFEWFHGNISKSETATLLRSPGNESGTFLVRESETMEDTYTLSVLVNDSKHIREVKHYRIKNLGPGGCCIHKGLKFEALPAMIETYSKPREEYSLMAVLTRPCMKPKPAVWDLSKGTRDQWEIPKEDLKLLNIIGTGNFGEVWKGLWKEITYVAIKMIRQGAMEPEKFLAEAAIMKQLKHPKLLTLFAVCTKEEPILIVTELMPNGSLKDYLKKNPDIIAEDIIDIAIQIADGMSYLEKKCLIHRDLAARNILMGGGNQVKIADFGLARVIDEGFYLATSGTVFPLVWTSPEAATHRKFTIKSDIWAFGIVLVEMTLKGNLPYPGVDKLDLLGKLEQDYRHPQPLGCPDDLYRIMLSCWRKKPEERPTFEELYRQLESCLYDC